jgi:hypothetical protein
MNKFTTAYIECALWASHDDNDEPMDDRFGLDDIAPEAIKSMEEDCADFQNANAELLADIDDEQAGHDFWLTRNGHGSGFWDRGLGKVGEQLTAACGPYGSSDLYVGDDGKVYVS